MDGHLPRGAPRAVARRGRRVGGRLRRARGAQGRRDRSGGDGAVGVRRRSRRDPRAAAAAMSGRVGRRRRDGSTWWATGRSTASTSTARGRSSCRRRCSRRYVSRSAGAILAGERHEDLVAGVRERVPEEHRAFLRRAARRGAPHVPPARRPRRVQRHLGVGSHAAPAALKVGRARFARVVRDPVLIVDASVDEMCALVRGTGGLGSDELEGRAPRPGAAIRRRTRHPSSAIRRTRRRPVGSAARVASAS